MVAVAGDSSPNALGVQFLTVANGAGVSFSGNAFTGPGTAGSKGAFLATAAAPALAITSSGNTFAGFETGLYVSNNEPDIGGLAGAAASLALPSGTVTAPAGGKGVYLLGDPAGPAVTLDLTGSTVAINGAGSGLVLSGSQAALAGNTLGSVAFAGTLTKYVTLTGAALAGTTVNGQSVSYGVVTGGVASAAQAFDIVDKIVDAVDAPGAGFVQLQAGDVFVTPNSFSTPATTTPDIQRAVNVLPAGGGTVLIKSGGYTGNVDTTAAGKAVTLSPGGPGVAATVNVAGNLTLDANDTLAADLNGPASYDQFVVTGNAALGSAALAVTLGYTPTAGDQFTLVSAGGSRTGTFSNASPIVVGGTKLYPVYDATTAKLTTNVPMNVYVDDNFTGPTGSTVTLPGGGTATIGYDAFPTVTAGQAAVAAAGTLTVFDGNYASENVTFLAGETVRLNVNPAANGGTGSTVVTLGSAAGSGTLDLNRLTFNTGATGASTQFAGQVTGVGTSALVKQGVGTFTLTNPNNDYRGGTAIAGGTLKTGASEVIPDQSLVTISGGGQLFLSGNAETVGGLAGTDPSATVALGTDGELYTGANNQSVSFAGTVNGAGSVVKVGTGTQTLGGANTHTGSAYFPAGTATAVYSGTLQLTNATPLAAGTRVDTTTGTLALAGPATFANEVYGSGSVAVNASTQLTNAANSYSGGTTVTAGTLTVTNDGQLGAAGGGVAATGAAVVSLGNGVTSGRAVTLQSGASLSVPSGTATLTGAVSGGILTGPGAVTASGATFTGVRIANTLDVTTAGGTTTFANTINQGTLTVVAGTTATLAAFTQSSGGRLMVLGTANVSGLTISGYTQVSGSGVLANTGSSDLTVSPGGILNVGYQEPLVGTASVVGGGTIDLGSRNIQLYGVVRNDGTLSTSSPASTRRVYVNSGGTYYTGSPPGTVGTGVAIAIRPGGVQRVGN